MRETHGHGTLRGPGNPPGGAVDPPRFRGSMRAMLTTLVLLVACNNGPKAPSGGGGGGAPGGNGGFLRQPAPTEPAPAPEEPHTRTHPTDTNVLLLILDDVGVDKVAAYKAVENAPPTPALSKLADQGRVFRHAWVEPMCSPTRAMIMTGRHARRTGVGQIIDWFRGEGEPDLADAEITIAEMLEKSDKDWSTSFVGKWHLSSGKGVLRAPGRQGFDWYQFVPGNLREGHGSRGAKSEQEEMSYAHWEEFDNGEKKTIDGYILRHQADTTIARMKEMPEPWFVWTAFTGVHVPLSPPPANLYGNLGVNEKSSEADLFDATLRALDVEVGRIVGSLTAEQRAKTTIIVIGDNGTPDQAIRPPLEARQGKGSVYELGVRVPLIVTGPLVEEPGPTDALVSGADIFATVADLAGVDLGTLGVPIDGKSFYTALKKPNSPKAGHEYVYAEKFEPNGDVPHRVDLRTVRDARWKLHVEVENGAETEKFFDLEGKEFEGANLLRNGQLGPAQQEAHDRLRAEYDRMVGELGATTGRAGSNLPVKIPN